MDLKFPLERLKCPSTIANVFQRLFVTFVLFNCILAPSSAQETVDFECVYSNSSNSYCHNLCPLGCLYPLLPKPCSPEGQVREMN